MKLKAVIPSIFFRRLRRGTTICAVLLVCQLCLWSCGGRGRIASSGAEQTAGAVCDRTTTYAAPKVAAPTLDIPHPPAMLSGDSLRMAWLAEHYWDNFDWRDDAWISDTTALEATFTPWAQLLSMLPEADAASLSGTLFRKGNGHPAMQLRLLDVADYFWRHPNSPFRSEELYIPVLEAILAAPDIDTLYRLRPQSHLASAKKNRPGMKAADFTYTRGSGAQGRLSALRADYTLLMFYNPGCPECERLEGYIPQSEVFAPLIASGRLKVLAIYPDDDVETWQEHLPQMPAGWIVGRSYMEKGGKGAYVLPGIPALYLLDRNKRVLIKDRPVDEIEAWLTANL